MRVENASHSVDYARERKAISKAEVKEVKIWFRNNVSWIQIATFCLSVKLSVHGKPREE